MKIFLIFTLFLFSVNYGVNAAVCYNSWQGENMYVPFQGCVDEDGEDWGMEWRNPYQ